MCRIGEAANPGPQFRIGCFNPSGLVAKGHIVHQSMNKCDILYASETHLSQRAMTPFKASLRHCKSNFQYVVGGHPVPVRHDRSLTGQWRGVAVIAKHPSRAVPAGWSSDIQKSCRVGHFSTLIHGIWVTAGVLYGECEGSQHPQYLETNDALLHAVATQVCALDPGPRVVAGDFNVTEGSLAAHQVLLNHGFKDVQQLAWERWGQYPQLTCKNATRKDFIYLSPELQQMCTEVIVREGVWSDHAVLEAVFEGGIRDIPRYIWTMPQPLTWPGNMHVTSDDWFQQGDVGQTYADAWQYLETQAISASSSPISRNCTGRGKQRSPRCVYGQPHAPLRAGRFGDVEPHFHSCNLQHARWFHQVRRIQAYVRHAKGNPHVTPHAVELWSSIKRAKGFAPSFDKWWMQCDYRTAGAPEVLPIGPPSHDLASCIYHSVLLALRALEKQLKTTRLDYARIRRAANPNLIFQDVKRASVGSVDLLIQPKQSKIASVDPSLEVVLATPHTFEEKWPVYVDGQRYDIIHAESDCLWLDRVDGLRPGLTVTQCVKKGSLDDLFKMFRDEWTSRWNRHSQVPASQWNQIVNFAQHALPHVRCRHEPITKCCQMPLPARARRRLVGWMVSLSMICVRFRLQHFKSFVRCLLEQRIAVNGRNK